MASPLTRIRPALLSRPTGEDHRVTTLELFFDLVFVFAVTQLTVLTAHHLTPDGIARSVIVGWLIWWAWTQFTWTLNPADTTHRVVRVVTLAATGVALVMAASVERAFAADALWFALPYVIVRLLGLGLQVGVEAEREGPRQGGVFTWAALSLVGLGFVLLGAVLEPGLRPAIWGLAILADLVSALVAVSSMAPVWALAVVAVALLAIVAIEGNGPASRAPAGH